METPLPLPPTKTKDVEIRIAVDLAHPHNPRPAGPALDLGESLPGHGWVGFG